MYIEENHQNEQYFFDQTTINAICDWLEGFSNPCILCAPMVSSELHRRGQVICTLDIDLRFESLTGFKLWDIFRPAYLDEQFDIIVCDPPFFNVSLSQLYDALHILSHYDLTQKMFVSYLSRRADAFENVFHHFGMIRTGIFPKYQTVKNCDRNEIEFFANFKTGIKLPC